MKVTIAILATLLAAFGASAEQNRSPFTGHDAELMSAAWPQIREANSFEDIDWKAVGLDHAPGDREARRVTAAHWGSLRTANRFSDIDWRATTGERSSSSRSDRDDDDTGPFTNQEAALMSAAWSEIRQADSFDDINWKAVGLAGAPGDRDAREIMESHWDSLRRAAQFRDIDWEESAGYRGH